MKFVMSLFAFVGVFYTFVEVGRLALGITEFSSIMWWGVLAFTIAAMAQEWINGPKSNQ